MYFVFLDDQVSGKQMVFREPDSIISASSREDLPAAFAAMERAQADGKWLAGTLAYELGHALESKFDAPASAPLLQLGVFDAPDDHAPVEWLYTRHVPHLDFTPSWSEADYLARFKQVQAYLRAGDCYQVNLTFPMVAENDLSLSQLYAAFRRRQPGRYGAIVDLGGASHVSFSPELFFERRGREMRMRPMKGTRPRGEDDAAITADMRAEPKSQAENLMIVDLLRNDLSRLCEAGTVKVPELFTLETYPTLHQMTSEVTGRLRDGVTWEEIFRGLFPCGSVTGAPKIRAMEIIEELESGPRGLYCGSVGYIAPNGDASFSVAIRTAAIEAGRVTYSVGSGVVLDSDGPDEYRECLLKAKIFDADSDGVIETLRLSDNGVAVRGQSHAERMADATGLRPQTLLNYLSQHLAKGTGQPQRLRILAKDGRIEHQRVPLSPLNTPVKLAVSKYRLNKNIQETRIKTTARDFYDGERARVSALTNALEVIFLNQDDEICEGSFTSIFISRDGQLFTPPLSAGILPGILRAEMIASGQAIEATLSLKDLRQAEAIFVGNSLRDLVPAKFIDFSLH